MNLYQELNGCCFQQINIGQCGSYCQQISIGKCGCCCQQVVMSSNGNYCQQIAMGQNGCCCQQSFICSNRGTYASNNINNATANQAMIGHIIQENRNVPPFDGIHVNGSFKIFLTQSDNESVIVEADENIIQYIDTNVQNKILYISSRSGFLNMNNQSTIYIDIKNLQQLDIAGASSMIGQSNFNVSNLGIEIHGSSDLDLQLNGQSVNISISGSSDVVLAGNIINLSTNVSGSSKLNASCLEVIDADICILGASSAKIKVRNRLGYNVSGASSLKYTLNPIIYRANHDFTSSVKKY